MAGLDSDRVRRRNRSFGGARHDRCPCRARNEDHRKDTSAVRMFLRAGHLAGVARRSRRLADVVLTPADLLLTPADLNAIDRSTVRTSAPIPERPAGRR